MMHERSESKQLTPQKPVVTLENWVYSSDSQYLYGDVKGHPFHKDGTFVRTSPVIEADFNNKKCETHNTHYLLGAPYESGRDYHIPEDEDPAISVPKP